MQGVIHMEAFKIVGAGIKRLRAATGEDLSIAAEKGLYSIVRVHRLPGGRCTVERISDPVRLSAVPARVEAVIAGYRSNQCRE